MGGPEEQRAGEAALPDDPRPEGDVAKQANVFWLRQGQ